MRICMWLFIISAVLTMWSIILALITNEVSLLNYVLARIEHIFVCLLLAFICGKTKVTYIKNEE